jgi:hypothetical protein
VLAIAGFSVLSLSADAQVSKPEEFQVKAAYLYNFGKFISWPANGSSSSFLICVLGRDPFGAILESTIAGDSIDSKKLVVKRISSTHEAESCRILYISNSEAADLPEILPSVQKLPIATVSDIPGFINHGGIIEFVLRENRVKFKVNLMAARQAGLTLSSQLLKVAVEVRDTQGK